jgi:hypothetical protein
MEKSGQGRGGGQHCRELHFVSLCFYSAAGLPATRCHRQIDISATAVGYIMGKDGLREVAIIDRTAK